MSLSIQVEHFAKRFGDKGVHKDINLSIIPGECLGLLGGSGAGKSVILRNLIGLEKPDSGKIYIGDDEISTWPESRLIEIRKKVAYVFQGGALFDSMTVFNNLAYPLKEHTDLTEKQIKEKVLNLLSEFDLNGSEYILPAELSGGMQKRVGLLRSIIMEPQVILYDEPTAGLDPFNTVKIRDMILKLKATGVTSIFVTHDIPSALSVCDRLALIGDGETQEVMPVNELSNSPEGPLHDFIHGKRSFNARRPRNGRK